MAATFVFVMAASVMYRLRLILAVFLIFNGFYKLECHDDHGHGHAHDEPASFKYSRQANEPNAHQNHGHAHSHDHGQHDKYHDHGHGHAHDEPASFKYSRAANEANEGGHAHNHDHDAHGHGHGHSHEGHGHAQSHEEPTKEVKSRSRDTGITLWLLALGSTALISAAPVFILLFIPLENTAEHQPLLKVIFFSFVRTL